MIESPFLTAPPGVNVLQNSWSQGVGEVIASLLLETDMTLPALLEYYRQQLLEPGWEVQQEAVGEELATLTWTFRDEGNHLWFGVLMVGTAGEGLQQVRLWLATGVRGGHRLFDIVPEVSPRPVPVPSRTEPAQTPPEEGALVAPDPLSLPEAAAPMDLGGLNPNPPKDVLGDSP